MTRSTVTKKNREISKQYRQAQRKVLLQLLLAKLKHPLAPVTVFVPSYSNSGCFYLTGVETTLNHDGDPTIILFTTAK